MAEWTSRIFGFAADSDLKDIVAQIEEENNEYMAFDVIFLYQCFDLTYD